MTREDFEREGFQVVRCNGDRRCSPLPHIHAKVYEDVEYCPVGESFFVDTLGFAGVPARRIPLEVATEAAGMIFRVAKLSGLDWKMNSVFFV